MPQQNPQSDFLLSVVTAPPEAIRESLTEMYVAISRTFPAKDPDEANAIADHYQCLNALLTRIEIMQERAQ